MVGSHPIPNGSRRPKADARAAWIRDASRGHAEIGSGGIELPIATTSGIATQSNDRDSQRDGANASSRGHRNSRKSRESSKQAHDSLLELPPAVDG